MTKKKNENKDNVVAEGPWGKKINCMAVSLLRTLDFFLSVLDCLFVYFTWMCILENSFHTCYYYKGRKEGLLFFFVGGLLERNSKNMYTKEREKKKGRRMTRKKHF